MDAIGIRIRFKTQQWPENLKAADAGKLMMWMLGSVGRVARRPSMRWAACTARWPATATSRASSSTPSTGSTSAAGAARRPRARGAVPRGAAPGGGLHAVQDACAPHLHRPRAPLGDRLSPAAVLERVVAHGRHRQRLAREGPASMKTDSTSTGRCAARALRGRARAPPAAAAGAQGAALAFTKRRDQPRPGAHRRPVFAQPSRRTSSRRCTSYDHLARPSKIKPLTADGMPEVSADFRVWTVKVQPGIYFADDPAFKGKKRELVAAGLRLRAQAHGRPGQQEPGRGRHPRHQVSSAWPSCARRPSRTRSPSTTTRRSRA